MTQVLEEYRADGFDSEFEVTDAGSLRCLACDTTTKASDVVVRSSRRLEGASDPADMATVVAIACPACARQGTIVVRYGPEASEAEAALLQHVRDARQGSDAGFTTPEERPAE